MANTPTASKQPNLVPRYTTHQPVGGGKATSVLNTPQGAGSSANHGWAT